MANLLASNIEVPMIICRELKVIFIKTKKVGGTSFEIALSKFCGPRCIITPISAEDEVLRQKISGRTAQNYASTKWPYYRMQTRGEFKNHVPAPAVKAAIPGPVWDKFKKITIVRNPYDVAISKYFWVGGEETGLKFDDFLVQHPDALEHNKNIAPLDGPAKLDHYLRYENLEQDMADAGLEQVYDVFKSLRAKGKSRPSKGAGMAEMYCKYPRAAELVAEYCADEIAAFGYDWK